jgi:hypothetical protein
MLHRIRLALQDRTNGGKLGGDVEGILGRRVMYKDLTANAERP